jgi:PAS domain S-box-containing protein
MLRLRDIPIRQKLTLITMLTSSAALGLACVALIGFEQITSRRSMTRDINVIADIVGYNSVSAVSFQDSTSAELTLKALVAQPHILAACIYDAKGNVFAKFVKQPGDMPEWPAVRPAGTHFGGRMLEVFRRMELGDGTAATLYIRSDLAPLRARLQRYALIAALVMVAAAGAAYIIIARLQRVISEPLSELASTVDIVAREKNYAIRAVKKTNDELGGLIDGFNNMLAQIQARDSELNASRKELERRVDERTATLRQLQEDAAQKAAELRFIFEALPVGVSWDNYGKLRNEHIVNESFFRISGLQPGNASRTDALRQATHPEDLPRQDELRQRLDRGEADALVIEKRYVHADGGIVWVMLTMKVFRGADGGIQQRVTTIVDITERKRTEQELQQTHNRLLEVSRQAGMAEVATGVLHNVGNVLNSVNVSATLAIDLLRKSQGTKIGKLTALLREHEHDLGRFFTEDPRAEQIPGYLALLDDQLEQERTTISSELGHLRKHIEHIKDIVAMQQSYAKVSGVSETVPICELVEDALRMNAGALFRHGLQLVREFDAKPTVVVERHKVLQILVNFIRNAKYACDDSGRPDKVMTVRVTADDERVRISIKDNGIGIPAENLTRIFAHGFTTRQDGHGFGLHSGALAAKELGGAIHVHSDGPGLGATFTLEIPLKPVPAQ